MKRGLFRDRKFYLFVGLMLVLVAVNLNQWRGAKITSTLKAKDKAENQKPVSEDPILLAERLTAEKTEFRQEKRNIFAFFQTPPPETQFQEMQQQQENATSPRPDLR